MDKNSQETYFNYFIDHKNTWKVSKQSDSSQNILRTIKNFQKIYHSLQSPNELNEKFMMDINPSLFVVNNKIISFKEKTKMLQEFKQIVFNEEDQKLISTYANQSLLYRSYLQLLSEHPEINQYQAKNSRNMYKVDILDDGAIKIVATNLSNLKIKNENAIPKYKSFGIRSTVILSKNHEPIIKYSHFLTTNSIC